jgi:DNA-directed RNA polymerase specialized sigma24 family protein
MPCLKAYLHLPSFREEVSFEAWLTRILADRYLDRIKGAASGPEESCSICTQTAGVGRVLEWCRQAPPCHERMEWCLASDYTHWPPRSRAALDSASCRFLCCGKQECG